LNFRFMKRKKSAGRIDLWGTLITVIGVLMLLSGCVKETGKEMYHAFPDHRWARFNLLSFEMPVEKPGNYDIHLFARFNPDFQFEKFGFSMIMTTPSGEERINEYKMKVRDKTGDFCVECSGDSCTGNILLKKGISITRKGILKVEIENLIPRLVTEGILGVGISVRPSGK